MYFSAQQFQAYINSSNHESNRYNLRYYYLESGPQNYDPLSLDEARRILREVKTRIANRDTICGNLTKFFRPWNVVPELKNFKAPVGDYAIGVEVEKGFVNREAVVKIANVIKDWKYICLDEEGGRYPLEVTFPPVLLSKFGRKSQVSRYLKLLSDNAELIDGTNEDDDGDEIKIGCHINVSKGGVSNYSYDFCNSVYNLIKYDMSVQDQLKYFNRTPYTTILLNQGHYLEFKMFDTTQDYKTLKRYINIAVALTDLICTPYSQWRALNKTQQLEKLHTALELGYNKR